MQALEAVKKNLGVNIRLYAPALMGYCMYRDGEGAARVAQIISEKHKVSQSVSQSATLSLTRHTECTRRHIHTHTHT